MAQQPLVGQGLLNIEAVQTHSDTPHTVGILGKSDQPEAENSTWQHTTLTTDRHLFSDGIRTHNTNKRTVADLRPRPRGHWDRRVCSISQNIITTGTFYIVGVSASIGLLDTQLILAHFRELGYQSEMKPQFKFISDLEAATVKWTDSGYQL